MAAGAEFWITYCVRINGVNNTPYSDNFSSSLSGTPETAVFSDSGVVFYDYRGENYDGEIGSLDFPNPYKYNNEYYQIAAIHCDGSDAIDRTFNVSGGCQIVVYYGEDPENGGNTGDDDTGDDGNSGNNSNPSTAIIRYFFKSSGDPADYTTGYVGYDEYTETINHYGLSLVAGSNTTRTLTYYTDSEQSETGTYSITSPKTEYLLYNIVSLPELGQEDYKKENFDIKVYCYKAPTITVAYTSTPDTLFGNPPATISVQPNAYGKVGSFTADWGMIGGMTVTTTVSNIKNGYKFLNWTIEKGSTTETETENEYQYTVNTFDNVTITANFERLPAVKLQVNPSGAGTVSPSAGIITPTGNDYKIKLTASPNENYKFDNWTKNSATISSSREYTYTATKGENTTITANFSSTTQPDTPDAPEAPTDGEIATNDYIYNLCAYANTSTYSLSTSGDYIENKCPTKSHILTNNGGQLINISNSYSDDQCVKESDLSRNSRTINFIIRNSTGAPMNGTTISMYENGSSTKTHSVTWPSTNNDSSGEVSNSYTISSNDFSKFNSSLKFKWDGTYIVNKKLNCQFNNGSLGKNIKVNGNDSLNHMTGSVDFTIDEKLDYFIRISNNTAKIIFIISQA